MSPLTKIILITVLMGVIVTVFYAAVVRLYYWGERGKPFPAAEKRRREEAEKKSPNAPPTDG